jgi:ubiquinone/menaquinone biosynthesis C-methylase UbiE
MNQSKHTSVNIKKWDKWAPEADGKGRWVYHYLRREQGALIAMLDLKENMHFLDIGCGTGWAIGQAAQVVNEQGEFYGVDLSPKMIEKAKENFSDKNNFHFIEANSESIPLDDNMFDIIICTNSFHHYLHPDKAMKEIHRLLKPGGKIYILDPTADTLLIKLADKIIEMVESAHVKMYSTKEFKQLMLNAGLKYLESRVIHGEKVHVGER